MRIRARSVRKVRIPPAPPLVLIGRSLEDFRVLEAVDSGYDCSSR